MLSSNLNLAVATRASCINNSSESADINNEHYHQSTLESVHADVINQCFDPEREDEMKQKWSEEQLVRRLSIFIKFKSRRCNQACNLGHDSRLIRVERILTCVLIFRDNETHFGSCSGTSVTEGTGVGSPFL